MLTIVNFKVHVLMFADVLKALKGPITTLRTSPVFSSLYCKMLGPYEHLNLCPMVLSLPPHLMLVFPTPVYTNVKFK
jgi:hypothetical protein